MNVLRNVLFFFLLVVASVSATTVLTRAEFFFNPTPDNSPPIANPDHYTVHGSFSTPIEIPRTGVLKNDSDPDGNSLHCIFTSVDTTVGTAIVYANGKAAFLPEPGQSGVVTIPYTVCDNQNACSQGQVTFDVVNATPIAGSDAYEVRGESFETEPETPNGVLKNDTDPDGDIIHSFTVRKDFPQGSGFVYNDGRARFSRLPSYLAFAGTLSMEYSLCDVLGKCSKGTVTFRLLGEGENLGACSPCWDRGPAAVGAPVNVTNGNMYLQQTDYSLPGVGPALSVSRTYNSDSSRIGLFGRSWSGNYDESITSFDSHLARLHAPDGRAVYLGNEMDSSGPLKALVGDFHGSLVGTAGSGFTLTMVNGNVRQFNSAGKLVSLSDRHGNQTTLQYNTAGKLISVTDPFGRILSFVTNPDGQVLSIADSLGTVATYTYGASRQLLSVTYADNSSFQFSYDDSLRLLTVTDALGNILESHAYDGSGRALSSERQGGVERYSLNYVGAAQTDVTDGLGRVTKYTFDKSKGRNVVARVEKLSGCEGEGSQVQTWTYDSGLNVIAKTDALDHVTTFSYDGGGNRLTRTDATGTVSYSYNQFGQVLARKDQLEGVTTNLYDAFGNLLTSRDTLNNPTTFTYNARGQVLTATDGRGKVTSYAYDSSGNLISAKDANNISSSFFYDARGRLTKVRDALSRNTFYEYDPLGRVVKITHPDQSFVSFDYDLAGRRTAVTDERGYKTNYSYDSAYRLTKITDPLAHETRYSYDAMSNLVGITDAIARTTDYHYDDFDRLAKIIYPAATSGAPRLFETVDYDAFGNITQRVDTAGRTTTFAYDQMNRMESTIDATNKTTSFEYDQLSRTTALTDALNQRYEFTYDARGRQTQVKRAGVSLKCSYDAVGNVTERTDYNGTITKYAYDNLNRLTSITYPSRTTTLAFTAMGQLSRATNENGAVYIGYDNRYRVSSFSDPYYYGISYHYDASGNRTRLLLNGATYATYSYDAVNRLTNLKDAANLDFPHAYDPVNRLIARGAPNGVTANFTYDGLDRLTALMYARDASPLIANQYEYNDANNISAWSNASGVHAYAYDQVDRMISASNNSQPGENYSYDEVGNRLGSHLNAGYSYLPFNKLANTVTTNYSYDNNGNLLSKTDSSGTTAFSWNEENQLTQVVLPTGLQVNYKYDALGRRLQRITSAGANERYVYDGNDVLVDLNADWTAAAKYLNGPGIDNHLRQTSTEKGSGYFLTDHLGSTAGLTDSSGNLIEETAYDSFGNSSGDSRTRYGYTGRERDPDTGLLYYRARFYDPELGRFISEDPIGLAGGINQFAYVSNAPIDRNDSYGLFEKDVHYYLTYFLASKLSCLTQHEARLIAEADQSTDENPSTEPWLGWNKAHRQTNSKNHGFNEGNTKSLPELRGAAMSGGANYGALGRYLHLLQDTYSHRGFENPVYGQLGFNGTDVPFFGGFVVDNTNHSLPKSEEMARATFFEIYQFAKRKGCECRFDNLNTWWPKVSEFLAAGGSPEEKSLILGVPLR